MPSLETPIEGRAKKKGGTGTKRFVSAAGDAERKGSNTREKKGAADLQTNDSVSARTRADEAKKTFVKGRLFRQEIVGEVRNSLRGKGRNAFSPGHKQRRRKEAREFIGQGKEGERVVEGRGNTSLPAGVHRSDQKKASSIGRLSSREGRVNLQM